LTWFVLSFNKMHIDFRKIVFRKRSRLSTLSIHCKQLLSKKKEKKRFKVLFIMNFYLILRQSKQKHTYIYVDLTKCVHFIMKS
jgi:hypothetical protein